MKVSEGGGEGGGGEGGGELVMVVQGGGEGGGELDGEGGSDAMLMTCL